MVFWGCEGSRICYLICLQSSILQSKWQIGELVLFPTIRKPENKTAIVSASGTSCRHQIADGTGRRAMHPVEILWEALLK